jgi:hypothetical protein
MGAAQSGERVICFSLWGTNRLYVDGASANVVLARTIYPGWVVRIYAGPDVPSEVLATLRGLGASCRRVPEMRGPWHGLFWRFYAASDPGVRIMLSRDLDSRLNWRERAAVDEWLASGEPVHIMRDHPLHSVPILGGMWGVRDHFLRDMIALCDRWRAFHRKGVDQAFLARAVWPRVREHHLAHDELHHFSGPRSRPFPPHPPILPLRFVGEVVAPCREA